MDERRFDRLTQLLAGRASRRHTIAKVAAAMAGGLLAAKPASPTAANRGPCLPIGQPCGRGKLIGCGRCCSGSALRLGNGRQRCTCRPVFAQCQRADQCCSGLCLLDPPTTGSDVAVCIPFPPFRP